ncbi:tyrosine-protein phosphatase [Legionella nagasakiensis]|uniref:tyrosine-protein phosphatase n=1 Tax=Legionella nagasakiensis TaxID=535290 RepID=UPI001056CDC8|nr:tyrosine-protein phosphatase [Legionella nagasakiensis]
MRMITRISIFLFIARIFLGEYVFAEKFQCEKVFDPNLQLEQVSSCDSSYEDEVYDNLFKLKKTDKVGFDNKLFFIVMKTNNLGGVKVLFPGNHKLVYRSAYLAGSPMCIQSLSKSGIKTVINLYSGKVGYAEHLYPLESTIFKANGVQEYIQINHYMVDASHQSPDKLNPKITEIIKRIAMAKGNVLIHCYSGEHDTGVIFGVLNKCFNHQSLKSIEEDTKCHMGFQSAYEKITYHRVMDIIRQFPCKLLQ